RARRRRAERSPARRPDAAQRDRRAVHRLRRRDDHPMSILAKTAAAGGGVLLPEILAFTSSLALDRQLLREDALGSLAHLAMLAHVGIVPRDAAKLLAGGLFEIAAGEVALPDDEEDIHMAIESALGTRVGAASELLHSARSRNDQVALALRLYVREQ